MVVIVRVIAQHSVVVLRCNDEYEHVRYIHVYMMNTMNMSNSMTSVTGNYVVVAMLMTVQSSGDLQTSFVVQTVTLI